MLMALGHVAAVLVVLGTAGRPEHDGLSDAIVRGTRQHLSEEWGARGRSAELVVDTVALRRALVAGDLADEGMVDDSREEHVRLAGGEERMRCTDAPARECHFASEALHLVVKRITRRAPNQVEAVVQVAFNVVRAHRRRVGWVEVYVDVDRGRDGWSVSRTRAGRIT